MEGQTCRYMSKLTLVRARLELTGSYTATASNEDDREEVAFNLEVKGQRRKTKAKIGECLKNKSCLFIILHFLCACMCVCVQHHPRSQRCQKSAHRQFYASAREPRPHPSPGTRVTILTGKRKKPHWSRPTNTRRKENNLHDSFR